MKRKLLWGAEGTDEGTDLRQADVATPGCGDSTYMPPARRGSEDPASPVHWDAKQPVDTGGFGGKSVIKVREFYLFFFRNRIGRVTPHVAF